MANIELLAPRVRKWEGGYVNDPADRGGATNMGVTLATWRTVGYDKDGDGDIDAADIKLLNTTDFTRVLLIYWNRWKADQIKDQKVAEILVDWVWGSGKWGIIIPQRILGVVADGVVGPATIAAVNAACPIVLHAKIYAARINFLNGIVAGNPSQKRFINGWMNRLRDFK